MTLWELCLRSVYTAWIMSENDKKAIVIGIGVGICVFIILAVALEWVGYWRIDAAHREWKQQLQAPSKK